MSDLMKLNYVCDGNPDRIPKVGDCVKVRDCLYFVVEGYGATMEIDFPLYKNGKMYQIILLGHLLIPRGSPISVVEELLGGKLQ